MSDVLGLDEIIKTATTKFGPNLRFSRLSDRELLSIWKAASFFVRSHAQNLKFVNFPNVGLFAFKQTKRETGGKNPKIEITPVFVPSPVFSKFPGLQINRTPPPGNAPLVELNFSTIAQTAGLSRDEAELGLKDILNGLHKALRGGNKVVLNFPQLLTLTFQPGSGGLKAQYQSTFLASLRGEKAGEMSEPAESIIEKRAISPAPAKESSSWGASADNDSADIVPTRLERLSPALQSSAKEAPAQAASSNQEGPDHHESLPPVEIVGEKARFSFKQPFENLSSPLNDATLPALFESSHVDDIKVWESDAASAARTTDNLPLLGLDLWAPNQLIGKHRHAHTNQRLWDDVCCPICRHNSADFVDTREEKEKKQREYDKLVMEVLAGMDEQTSQRYREKETERQKQIREIAQANYKRAMEIETIKKSISYQYPLGDLFEKRAPPPHPDPLEAKVTYNKVLKDQIEYRRLKKLSETAEDKQIGHATLQRMKDEFETHERLVRTEKLNSSLLQRAALSEQIRLLNSRRQPAEGEAQAPHGIMQNTFVREEDPLYVKQRARARKLYEDQLALAKARRLKEVASIEKERKAGLEQLELSKDELSKDLAEIKRLKYETRRNLEAYWREQISIKASKQQALLAA